MPRPLASARAMRSGTCADVIQPCWLGQDYMRQKRERTETSFYIDWIKNLNISTDTQFNLAYGGLARSTSGSQNVAVLLNREH